MLGMEKTTGNTLAIITVMKPENLFPDGIKNNVRRNRSVRITKRQTKNLNHVRFIQAPSKLSTRIDTGTKDK